MKTNTYTFVNKDWGSEFWIVNNELYCAKILTCGQKLSSLGRFHFHKNKDETFYVLTGELLLELGDETYLLFEGDSLRVKPNIKHRFKAHTDKCTFLEISTHHENTDSHYIENE